MTDRARVFDRRFYGVVEGIVEDNLDPSHEGRIKVRFPWYDEGTVSDWCRVGQLYAGAGYGALFVPEIGDEVVVGFSQGDMRLPIVLGGLYNGKDKPPSHRGAGRDEKVIRTRGGHTLAFDEVAHTITIRAAGGQTIVLGEDGAITLSGAAKIDLGGGAIERAVLGDKLAALFNAHVHPQTPNPNTGTPVTAMGVGELSTLVKVK